MGTPRITVRVKTLPSTTGDGGDLNRAFTVHAGLAQTEVLADLRWWVELVKDSAERGWPIGPERDRAHSRDLFTVGPIAVSDRVGLALRNSAPYAEFIHEPGNPGRFVVDREINELVDALAASIEESLLEAFVRGFNSV